MYLETVHPKWCPPIETHVLLAEIRKIPFDDREVLIIIDDFTRPVTSVTRMVVEYAISKVGEERVAVVVASGMHRANTNHEVSAKIGPELTKRLRIYHHSPLCNFPLNKKTHNIIAVGCAMPHTFAGMSGDAKIILPGLRYFVDVMVFHKSDKKQRSDLVCSFKEYIDTFVNYTINSYGDPVRVCVYPAGSDVGGFRYDAWNDYTVTLPAPSDIAILVPWIKNADFQQSMNAMQVCKEYPIVKEGGTICIKSDTPEGMGVHYGFQQPNGCKPAFYDVVFKDAYRGAKIAFICPNVSRRAIQEYFQRTVHCFNTLYDFSQWVHKMYGDEAMVLNYPAADMMIGER